MQIRKIGVSRCNTKKSITYYGFTGQHNSLKVNSIGMTKLN